MNRGYQRRGREGGELEGRGRDREVEREQGEGMRGISGKEGLTEEREASLSTEWGGVKEGLER